MIRDGVATGMATQEYKPTPGDRDGFTFKCTDPTHPDWRSVSVDDVEKTSEKILPSCKLWMAGLVGVCCQIVIDGLV